MKLIAKTGNLWQSGFHAAKEKSKKLQVVSQKVVGSNFGNGQEFFMI